MKVIKKMNTSIHFIVLLSFLMLFVSCKTAVEQAKKRESNNIDLNKIDTIKYINSQIKNDSENCKLKTVTLNQNKNQITNLDICPIVKNDGSKEIISRYILIKDDDYSEHNVLTNSATHGLHYDSTISNIKEFVERQLNIYFRNFKESISKEENIIDIIHTPIKFYDLVDKYKSLTNGNYTALRSEDDIYIYIDPRSGTITSTAEIEASWMQPKYEVRLKLPIGDNISIRKNEILIFNVYDNLKDKISSDAITFSKNKLVIDPSLLDFKNLNNDHYNLFIEIDNNGNIQKKLFIGKLLIAPYSVNPFVVFTCTNGMYYNFNEKVCKYF